MNVVILALENLSFFGVVNLDFDIGGYPAGISIVSWTQEEDFAPLRPTRAQGDTNDICIWISLCHLYGPYSNLSTDG